ncbi:MAG: glycoside hydrolase family 127 protein, partial [Candidatus Aminicenantes bacterium]|nr:glycoside hydrolase family 127 protein [Candidatus Aminicenantes bacterium]
TFLDVAIKNADLLVRTFGPDKLRDIPGHQEVEIGLAKLYRVTGKQAYLDLAKFFLDERGRPRERPLYPADSPFALYNGREYMQDHKPVLEQDEAVGHAVRAMYMYAGMADVAALRGEADYVRAIDRLWANVVGKKLYITGGVGARHTSEAFGDAYELPNAEAYTETCAAIGNAFWNHRLFLLHGEARFMDVFERVLYNGLLSGVSLGGDRFFYQNPLASAGGVERSAWFEVACCPPNVTRFLPSLPGYVYAVRGSDLFVNLFVGSTAEVEVAGRRVRVVQETRYPWDGSVRFRLEGDLAPDLALLVRVPGWARGETLPSDLYRFLDAAEEKVALRVNGRAVAVEMENGYARLRRAWKQGDVVELALPMPVRGVVAHASVAADAGRVALQRGPLVYCLEAADNDGRVLDVTLPDAATLGAEFRPDLLNGVVVVTGRGSAAETDALRPAGMAGRPFIAVPYFAWANRGAGEMAVWLPRK